MDRDLGRHLTLSIILAGFLSAPATQAFSSKLFQEQTVLAGSLLKKAALSGPSQTERAREFIQSMGDEVVSYVRDNSLSKDEKKAKLKDVLNRNFDMNTISRFAMGRYWNDLSAAEQQEYRSLFEDMIVSIYAEKFSYYDGEKFHVGGIESIGNSDISVSSFIIPRTGDNILVDWRLRGKDSQYKIVDVAINNVSMIITQRSDFSSTIQRNGGRASVVLDNLRSRFKNTQ